MPFPRISLALLVAPLLAGCATVARTAPATPIAGEPAPASAYARMNAAIAGAGGLHAVLTTNTTEAPFPYTTTQQLWLDGAGRARIEASTTFLVSPPVVRNATSIVDGAAATVLRQGIPAQTQQALACHQAPDAAIATLFGCRGFLERSETLVQEGASYAGSPATAIISRGIAPGDGVITWFEDTLYVDRASGLPVALESAAVVQDGERRPLRTVTTYQYQSFDPSLTPGFLDASTLSGAPSAPVAALGDLAPGVGWPRRIDAGGLALELASTFVASEQHAGWLPYRAELSYRPAGDAFAAPEVALQLLPPGASPIAGAVFVDAPPGRIVVRRASATPVSAERLQQIADLIRTLVGS